MEVPPSKFCSLFISVEPPGPTGKLSHPTLESYWIAKPPIHSTQYPARTWHGTWMKRFFPYDIFGRLASLTINVIILLLSYSHCMFHMECLKENGWKTEREKKNNSANSGTSWTLCRSAVPWRCTTRFRPADRLCQLEMASDTLSPDQAVREGKVGS